MTPQEKANQLFNQMFENLPDCVEVSHELIVNCALISINEILNTIYNEDFGGHLCDEIGASDYWKQVKNELQNL